MNCVYWNGYKCVLGHSWHCMTDSSICGEYESNEKLQENEKMLKEEIEQKIRLLAEQKNKSFDEMLKNYTQEYASLKQLKDEDERLRVAFGNLLNKQIETGGEGFLIRIVSAASSIRQTKTGKPMAELYAISRHSGDKQGVFTHINLIGEATEVVSEFIPGQCYNINLLESKDYEGYGRELYTTFLPVFTPKPSSSDIETFEKIYPKLLQDVKIGAAPNIKIINGTLMEYGEGDRKDGSTWHSIRVADEKMKSRTIFCDEKLNNGIGTDWTFVCNSYEDTNNLITAIQV